ncbi:MAG: hypothetical protein JW747_02960 [Candidatus Aminicenantes bacterium]|nr:hypothetical protein [Candidatus Aminicenantes bacterium]
MSISRYYLLGWGDAVRQPKMAFLLWVLNALSGLVVYFGACGLMRRAFGHSLLGSELSERFAFRGVMELLQRHGRDVAALAGTVLILTAATYLLSLFLSGGVLHVLKTARNPKSGEKESRVAALFFEGAGRYFGRFLRLEIVALPMWIVFGILLFVFSGIAGNASDGWEKERLGFALVLALVGAAVLFVFLGMMIVDYARIQLVATDGRRVFKVFLGTLKFAARRFFKLLGLAVFFLITMGIVLALGEAVARLLGGKGAVVTALGFGVQQVLVLALLGARIAFLGAQARLSERERVSALDLPPAAQDAGGEQKERPDKAQSPFDGDAQ